MSSGSVPLGKAIEEFLGSPSAAAGMRSELSRFIMQCGSTCPVFTLSTEDAKESLRGIKKTADRRNRAEALESFFDYAKEQGWIRINPANGLIKKKVAKEKTSPPPPSQNVIRLSPEGRLAIEAEMEQLLKEKERVIEEVKEAREDGDLKENVPYHAARERLAMIEAQLRDAHNTLTRAIPLE